MRKRHGLDYCIATFVLASASNAFAFGNDDEWQSGFGQGTAESIITKGPGNEIYVACEAGSGRSSAIYFSLAGNQPEGDSIILTFDNADPEKIWINQGVITSDCRACAGSFEHIIERLKRHSSVHVMFSNGDAARFSLRGSAEAIGDCPSGFSQ